MRGYEVRLPEIAADLNRGSLGDAWWVSFGEQKRVSSGERQGAYQEYRCVYGEDVETGLRFLFNAMSAKEEAGNPLQGV